jgi:3-oxoadipate enol-lactonase
MNGPFAIADYSSDVRSVLDSLGIERVHLVGGSLGGAIACAVAAAVPSRVATVTAIGAALEPAEAEILSWLRLELRDQNTQRAFFDGLLAGEVSKGLTPEVAAEARRQLALERRAPDVIREVTLNAFAEDARSYAKSVACPVYVVTGERDESCPPDVGQRMAEALHATRFDILPSLGHLAMMQAPQVMAAKLTDFLARWATA